MSGMRSTSISPLRCFGYSVRAAIWESWSQESSIHSPDRPLDNESFLPAFGSIACIRSPRLGTNHFVQRVHERPKTGDAVPFLHGRLSDGAQSIVHRSEEHTSELQS